MRCPECDGVGFIVLWTCQPANHPTGWHDVPYRQECALCDGLGSVEAEEEDTP